MDRLHDARGLVGDDRAGIQRALVVIPMFPQSGKGKGLLVLAVNVKGLFAGLGGCPLSYVDKSRILYLNLF